jgi:hypothetical protein
MTFWSLGKLVGRLLFFGILLSWGIMWISEEVQAQTDNYNLDFSTYLGGSGFEQIRDVAFDNQGNIYVTGGTTSTQNNGFPVTQGAYDTSHNGWMDIFVTKFNPNGGLTWSTFIGGPNYDRAYAIEVDNQGNVYLGGRAGPGFPTTPVDPITGQERVVQQAFGGGDNGGHYGAQDGFVAKLKADGSALLWATYIGCYSDELVRDIDIDDLGQVYLAGAMNDPYCEINYITNCNSDPYHSNCLRSNGDMLIAKLSADGRAILWGEYFGGNGGDGGGPAVRVNRQTSEVYVQGDTTSNNLNNIYGATASLDKNLNGPRDQVLVKYSPTGNLLWWTYLGGNGMESAETHGLGLDNFGNPIVAVTTTSLESQLEQEYPLVDFVAHGVSDGSGGSGNYNGDGVVFKVKSDGSEILAGAIIGGSNGDGLEGVGIDAQNNIYTSGASFSHDFPTTNGSTNQNGDLDMIAVKLSSDLQDLLFASYLGGNNEDAGRTVMAQADGTFSVAGQTRGGWPTTNNAYQISFGGGNGDNVIAKFSLATPSIKNWKQMLVNWLTPTNDQNDDGKVNSLDWGKLIATP